MSCKVCRQIMTIRRTVFFGDLEPHPRMVSYGGHLSLRAENGTHYLHYENSSEIFYTEVELTDSWPVNFCPACGRDLKEADA